MGQHDLPGHNLDRYKESGVGVLVAAGKIKILNGTPQEINNKFFCSGFSFGVGLKKQDQQNKPHIAVTHQMVVGREKLWEGQKNVSKASRL